MRETAQCSIRVVMHILYLNPISNPADAFHLVSIGLGCLLLKICVDRAVERYQSVVHVHGDSFVGDITVKLESLPNIRCNHGIKPCVTESFMFRFQVLLDLLRIAEAGGDVTLPLVSVFCHPSPVAAVSVIRSIRSSMSCNSNSTNSRHRMRFSISFPNSGSAR